MTEIQKVEIAFFVIYQISIIGSILMGQMRFGHKNIHGEVVKVLPIPFWRKLRNIGVGVMSGGILLWCAFSLAPIWNTKVTLVISIILVIELAVAFYVDIQPERLCENGIQTRQGFILWENIEAVLEEKKSDFIRIKVSERIGYETRIFCGDDLKSEVEREIGKRIGSW